MRFILCVEDTSLPLFTCFSSYLFFFQQVTHDFTPNFMKKISSVLPLQDYGARFSKFYPEKDNIKFARVFLVIENFKALEFRLDYHLV